MNREEIEKMFDKTIWINSIKDFESLWEKTKELLSYEDNRIKQFIFNTIIPEVIKEILPEFKDTHTKDDEINSMRRGHNDCIQYIKQKAKELYWIDL